MAASYLQISDIKGECTVKGHEDWIELSGWSIGVSNDGSLHTASASGGGTTAKSSPGEVSFTIPTGLHSTPLWEAVAVGNGKGDIVIHQKRSGDKDGGEDYVKITLGNAYVTSYATGDDGDGSNHDHITMAYKTMKYEYWTQKDDTNQSSTSVPKGFCFASHAKI